MLADARLVAAKDLRIETRSLVGVGQMAPFAVLVLILFAVALDPDRGVLGRATAGLFWVAVLFSALLALQRAFALESGAGVRDALRLSGMDPAGVFLGKAGAVGVQLLGLELLLAGGVALLYGAELPAGDRPRAVLLLCVTGLAATASVASAGTLYGVLAAGLRVRDTLLPLLLLPVMAPVLLGATRATEAALDGAVSEGWPWCGLLVAFALVYLVFGISFFGTILEES